MGSPTECDTNVWRTGMLKSRLLLVFCLLAPQWGFAGGDETETEITDDSQKCVAGLNAGITRKKSYAICCAFTCLFLPCAIDESLHITRWEDFQEVLEHAHQYTKMKGKGKKPLVTHELRTFSQTVADYNKLHVLGDEDIIAQLEAIWNYPAEFCETLPSSWEGFPDLMYYGPFHGLNNRKRDWERGFEEAAQLNKAKLERAAQLNKAKLERMKKNEGLLYEGEA